jgi:hypothetical protein
LYVLFIGHCYYLVLATTVLPQGLHSFFEAQAVKEVNVKAATSAMAIVFIDYILVEFIKNAII